MSLMAIQDAFSFFVPFVSRDDEEVEAGVEMDNLIEPDLAYSERAESKTERVFIHSAKPSSATRILETSSLGVRRIIRLKNVLRTLHKRLAELPMDRQIEVQKKVHSQLASHFVATPIPDHLHPKTCARFCLYFWKELNAESVWICRFMGKAPVKYPPSNTTKGCRDKCVLL